VLENYQVFLAAAIFFVVYAAIVTEKIHRTAAAFAGAALVVLSGILSADEAVAAIDFHTIGLLSGMMIIVGVTRRTGLFEYLAVKAARAAGGRPVKIMASLSLITAVVSAFLDNVTTVLLIVPVTFVIAERLKISPLPFLIAEVIASNIGGTATLIGDPPNIMIGSATGLGFMDFLINLAPVVFVIYVLTIFVLELIYKNSLRAEPEAVAELLELDESEEIRDRKLLRRCLLVLALTILGFVLHQYVHLESSVVALCGAALLLLITAEDPERALQFVEWPVIFFFLGLFVVVGGLEKVGLIEAAARWALGVTGGELVGTGVLLLWLSALASAFVDNIPFVATMIPLIQDMGRLGGMGHLDLLWWSLSLGACLGGNGSLIGASANVVVAGMSEKRGLTISFMGFLKVAFPLMLLSIAVSNAYLLCWHLYATHLVLLATAGVGAALFIILRVAVAAMSKGEASPLPVLKRGGE